MLFLAVRALGFVEHDTMIAIAGGPVDKVEDVQTVIFNDNVIKLS